MFSPQLNQQIKQAELLQQVKLDRASEAHDKATKEQWELVDIAINAFRDVYRTQWDAFMLDMAAERGKFNDAKGKGLKDSQFRNTAAFPIAYVPNRVTGEMESKSLLMILQRIIPGLTHKNSINYIPFLKKYPMFVPGEYVTAQTYK